MTRIIQQWTSKGRMLAGLIVLLAAGLVWLGGQPGNVQATAAPAMQFQTGSGGSEACLGCHGQEGQVKTLPNGDPLNLTINPRSYQKSVHGGPKMDCISCHPGITGFPHPENTAKDLRDYTYQYAETCKSCHTDQYNQVQDSIHHAAMSSGNRNAPACTDCHNPHTQTRLKDEQGMLLPTTRVNIPQTCARCHNSIFEEYAGSVHGRGVLVENNPDVPTCTDCHGVHTIPDPTTNVFRLSSTEMCGKCHTNSNIMGKYKLSTDVLNTYVADFHGTTVTLFEKNSPDQATNKPVCYDCHGIHNIARVDDPQKGLKIHQNLLATCQRCHPDATLNFPDSWLSHYIPSPEHSPLVYYVQLFYKIFIPLVIGAMVIYVLTDFFGRRLRRKPAVSTVEGEPAASTPPVEPGEKE